MQASHFHNDAHLQGVILVAENSKIRCIYADGIQKLNYEPPTSIDQNHFSSFPLLNTTQFLIGQLTQQFLVVSFLCSFWESFAYEKDVDKRKERFLNGLNLPLIFYLDEKHPIWAGTPPQWSNYVTLHHLLTHTSGLPDYTKKEFFAQKHGDMKFYEFYHDDHQIIGPILELETLYQPGSYINESMTNMLLLKLILETMTNQKVDNLLTALFKEVNLPNTKVMFNKILRDHQEEIDFPNLADGLILTDTNKIFGYELPIRHTHPSNIEGIGTVVSTANDLYTWIKELHIKKSVITDVWLYDHIFTNHTKNIPEWKSETKKIDFALGFKLEASSMHLIDRGHLDTFATLLSYSPESQAIVIAMTNVHKFWLSKKSFQEREHPAIEDIWSIAIKKKSPHYKRYNKGEKIYNERDLANEKSGRMDIFNPFALLKDLFTSE